MRHLSPLILFSSTLFPLLVNSITPYSPTLPHPSDVSPDERESWCDQQKTSCNRICQSDSLLDSSNNCNPINLTFECTCAHAQNISDYIKTLPWFVCTWLRDNCTDKGPCPTSCGMERQLPPPITTGDINRGPATTSTNLVNTSPTLPSNGAGQPPSLDSTATTPLTPLTTAISSPAATTEPSSSQGVSPVSSATTTGISVPSAHGKGLSTGAKAGIAVGAVVGFALLLLLAFFLLKNRRKKQQAPLLADEGKSLGVGPSTMSHQDPYTDSPENAPAQNRFSWAPQPATTMAAVPPVSQRYSTGQPATSRDISNEEVAAGGYWQPPASQSPVSPQARKPSDVTAQSRTSMQEARAPPSPVGQSSYTAYNPVQQSSSAAAAAPSARHSQRLMDDEWDEDEARLDAEIAEIERMKQMREERAAMR